MTEWMRGPGGNSAPHAKSPDCRGSSCVRVHVLTDTQMAARITAGVAARVSRVEALFVGGPDTPCRTTWRLEPGILATYHAVECVEVPMDDLRAALAAPGAECG